jgi:hypothetical protein
VAFAATSSRSGSLKIVMVPCRDCGDGVRSICTAFRIAFGSEAYSLLPSLKAAVSYTATRFDVLLIIAFLSGNAICLTLGIGRDCYLR